MCVLLLYYLFYSTIYGEIERGVLVLSTNGGTGKKTATFNRRLAAMQT